VLLVVRGNVKVKVLESVVEVVVWSLLVMVSIMRVLGLPGET